MIDDLKRDEPKYPKQELSIVVPVTPSVNHMYIVNRNGALILTKKAKEYIKIVQNACKKSMKQLKWKTENENVWYYMDMYFYFPDKRIRDSHNCIKLLLDSLQGLLFPNDYFVMPNIRHVTLDRDNPRIEIIFYAE